MKKIAILLSTYNGSKYLKNQLDSLMAQTYKDFEIIVRDDGSSDNTIDILTAYNMKILEENHNLGAKRSFSELLSYAIKHNEAQYFMFCDQDDVWNKDKIEKTYHKMKELEKIYSKNMPLLVHSDLKVVDNKIEVISQSFWKYQSIDPNKQKLSDFIVNNNITGCTMMINRSLAKKVKTIPKEAIMHDWWVAMVVSTFGKIDYLNESLILYRQHGSNDTGAKEYGFQYFVRKFFEKPSFEKYILQSQAFLTQYGHELDVNNKKMLEEFSLFDNLSKWGKVKMLFKYKIWKNGFMRNLGLILFA